MYEIDKLEGNVAQACADLNGVKEAIEANGVEVPDGTPTSGLPSYIDFVYKAGQSSMVDESKIIEKTVSGSVVFVDDVSEIKHGINVSLSSDTVTDFSNVNLTVQKGNLFNCSTATKLSGNATLLDVAENGLTVRKTTTSSYEMIMLGLPDWLEGRKITVYSDWTCSGENTGYIRVNWNNQLEGNQIIVASGASGVAKSGVVTAKPDGAKYLALVLYGSVVAAPVGSEVYYKNITVVADYEGEDTDFKPYINITPNADGTVSVIESPYPSIKISSDNTDVNISMTYQKSWGMQQEQNHFMNVYQSYGMKEDYEGAFAGSCWCDELFTPMFNMKPGNAQNMFWGSKIRDLVGCLNKQKATLNFSSCYNANQLFAWSSITHIGEINLANCQVYYAVFDNASKLHTIDKLIVSEKLTYSRWFHTCRALENITIEGVIGNSLDMQYSTPLTANSMVSIVEALSSTASGMTLTLSQTAINNADWSTTDYADWATLIATKTNWTFSLV